MTVGIASYGVARFGRRQEGLVDLLLEAGSRALEGAPSGIMPEAILVGAMASGALGGKESLSPSVADGLGLVGVPAWRVETASATGAGVFQAAVELLAGGRYSSLLVLSGEKMTALPTPAVTTALARSLSPHETSHGATMPSMAALVTQVYASRYKIDPDWIGLVTVANRKSAAVNPNAHFTAPVTMDEVNSSRMVSNPLRLLHVSPISDGAAAVLLTHSPCEVEVAGTGQATDRLDVTHREELTTFKATREAARRAYEQARVTRKEIRVAEVHDAFAPFELIDLEDVGLCGPGEAMGWLEAGHGSKNGTVPINPSGGLLGRGHPVGASGLIQIVEVARQIEGEAGDMQAGRPKIGLAQSVGGLGSHNFVTILRRKGAM